MIRALVFDFDGLILDTETSVFEAWRLAYEDHGEQLSRLRWQASIGTDGSSFDPLAELRARVGTIDEAAIQARRRAFRDDHLAGLAPMPGVETCLRHARAEGLGLAVASSSPRDWVEGHLDRLQLLGYFDALATREEVTQAKPAPDLYLLAAEKLDVAPARAVALEDSPNGVTAAKRAGLRCIAVPGPMTRSLDFGHADEVLPSLAHRSPAEWLGALGGASRVR